MPEWKITRNGELWTDRFTTIEDAISDLIDYKTEDPIAKFELSQMTEDEIKAYQN